MKIHAAGVGTAVCDNQDNQGQRMESQLVSQRAYLLGRIRKAPGHKRSRSDLFGAKGEMAKVGLDQSSGQKLVEELVAEGHLAEHKGGKGVSYVLTEAGAAYAGTISPPPPPRLVDKEDDPSPDVHKYRRAYLLLQLLVPRGGSLPKGTVNKIEKSVSDDLELSPATANDVRATLIGEGLVERIKEPRTESYRLTQEGRALLGTLKQHPTMLMTIRGGVLNDLRALAGAAAEGGSVAPAPEPKSPRAEDLSQAAFEAFQELRRERYSHTTLVPIYAVRRLIAERFGSDAARHDVLDDAILELWRRGRVKIIPISDFRDSTEDQRADSIGDASQTLFYME